jgi:hypothetical protein
MKKIDNYFCTWSFTLALWLTLHAFNSVLAQGHSTNFVESSAEVLPLPLPRKDQMPREISFDELSVVEIQAIRKQLYEDSLFQRDLSGVTKYADALSGCMTWLYKIPSKTDKWKPIGFSVGQGHEALIKVNGAYREFYLFLSRSLSNSLPAPTYHGRMVAAGFRPLAGWAEYRQVSTHRADQLSVEVAQRNQERYWKLEINSSSYAVIKNKESCKFIDASCRRYVVAVDQVSWATQQPDNTRVQLPILVNEKFNIGVEDMCPWNLSALIEKNEDSRIFGYGSGVSRNGFPKNPPLLKAIEPFILNSQRKFK